MRYKEIIERRMGKSDLAKAPSYSDRVTLGFEFEMLYRPVFDDYAVQSLFDEHTRNAIDEDDLSLFYDSLFADPYPELNDGWVWVDESGDETDEMTLSVKNTESGVVLHADMVSSIQDFEQFVSAFYREERYAETIATVWEEQNDTDGDAVPEIESIFDSDSLGVGVEVVADQSLSNGAEVVTPPLAPDEAWALFDKITDIMNDYSEIRTDNTCGLHVNIGTFSLENFDILKFMLFLDEKHMNKMFPVRGLTSSLRKTLIDILSLNANPNEYKSFNTALLAKLGGNRYNSINFTYLAERGYIEVRAPGGTDYEKRGEDVRELVSRIYRCIELAIDPHAYRKEYIKKISKFIDLANKPSDADGDHEDLLSRFYTVTKSWNKRQVRTRLNGITSLILALIGYGDFNGEIPAKIIPEIRKIAQEVHARHGEGPSFSHLSKNQLLKKADEEISSLPTLHGLVKTLVNQYVKTTTDNDRY